MAAELYSDRYLARLLVMLPDQVRQRLTELGIDPKETRDETAYYSPEVIEALRSALAERQGRRGAIGGLGGHVGTMT